jgi:RHS repeat-associated protein
MMRNGHVYAFVTDNLGSVTDLIDTSGVTDATYTYDPYGNQTSETGGEDNFNLLGYTGALADPARGASTGYTHLGNRWQNPATGTFTQQDTINQLANPANANAYAYAADNPANYVDPTGRSLCQYAVGTLWIGLGLVAAVALSSTVVGAAVGAAVLGYASILAVNEQC